jgi:hypothetical protein
LAHSRASGRAEVAAIRAQLVNVARGETPAETQAGYVGLLFEKNVRKPLFWNRAAGRIKLELGSWNPTADEWTPVSRGDPAQRR